MMPQHRVWLLALCLIGIFPLLTLKAQNLEWVRQLESDFYDESRSVSTDSLGNVYISGYTVLGAGDSDAFVSKYDASGSLQWTRQLGIVGHDVSLGVSADSLGDVYTSGYTGGIPGAQHTAAFVAKYSTIPEPGTLLLGTLASVGFLLRRKSDEWKKCKSPLIFTNAGLVEISVQLVFPKSACRSATYSPSGVSATLAA